ncbi:hypothetical protein J2S74_002986 [Evansella vedderi]|uniref:Uncharacterized protein n=1 Tax=Evansella vedderi TaxID=38282 RepID=A0ABT9ZWJ3_9BACI|nr:hypothetical protein [Evansella vedderi]MDQ0255604.1 hypothetical protein [Evansella vedderi]
MDVISLINNNKITYQDGEYIYFLLDGEEVVYVGKTIKPFPPIPNHRDKIFTDVSILPIDSFDFEGTADVLLIDLLIKLLPKYNTTLPTNERYMTKGIIKKRFDVNGYELNRLIKKNGAKTIFHDFYDIKDIFLYE